MRPFLRGNPRASTTPTRGGRHILDRLPDLIGVMAGEEVVADSSHPGTIVFQSDLALAANPRIRCQILDHHSTEDEIVGKVPELLRAIAAQRTWREVGTVGPPACTVPVDGFAARLLDAYAVDLQDLLDDIVRDDRAAWPGEWRTLGEAPPHLSQLKTSKNQGARNIERAGRPFMTGRLEASLSISTLGDRDEISIRRLERVRGHGTPYEIRVERVLPETLKMAIEGIDVTRVISNRSVDALGGSIMRVQARGSSINLKVEIEDEPKRIMSTVHADAFQRHLVELDRRRDAIGEAVLASLRMDDDDGRAAQAEGFQAALDRLPRRSAKP